MQVAGAVTTRGRGVFTRTVGGPDVPGGLWIFTYGTGANQDTTRVECPCGTTTYRFNGIGLSGNFSGWLAGTMAEVTLEESGVVLERQQFTWTQSEPISPDPTTGTGGIWADPAVFRPLLGQRVTTRGAQSWTTTQEYHTGLGNFNDYGQAWRIYEDGELHRSVTRTFQYGFTPYIVGRVASDEVRVGAEIVGRSWAYNLATGFLTATSFPGTFSFTATAEGNVATITDGRQNVTTLSYTWGQVQEIQTPGTRTVNTVAPDGWITAVNNQVDYPTTYTFDGSGRLTSTGQFGVNAATVLYDPWDRWVIANRGAGWARSNLDGFGRVISTLSVLGVQTRVTRDGCGRTTYASHPYTSGAGNQGVTTTVDALGRIRTVVDGDGTTQYAYTGIDVTVTDPNGRQTVYDQSGFGDPGDLHLTRVTDAAGQHTNYGYDVLKQLIAVTGPGPTPARTWVYGGLTLLSDTQPESGTTTYQHDAAGNRTHVTHVGGTTVFTYDGENRIVQQNAPGTADDVAYEYDPAGRLLRLGIPNLTSPTSSITYAYDLQGRLTLRRDVVGGQTYQSTYAYDANDRLTSITYPSTRVIGYEYDDGGRPTMVRNNGAPFATGFTYGDSGRVAAYTTGAVTHTLTYDARQRVQRLTSGAALDLTYGYDAASQVSSITDTRPGMSQSFGYDALGRLTVGNGPWGQSTWTYDAAGNRLSELRGALTTYQYDLNTQRLLSTTGAGAETFTYDARGRLTGDSQGQYTYNARELLATVTKPGLTAAYTYDATGLRIASTLNADTTTSIRGAGGELFSEYRTMCGTSVWTRDAVYVGGRLLGSVRANTSAPTVALVTTAATLPETQTSHSVGVRLTTATGAPTPCPVSVVYQTAPGTASAGADFTNTGGTLQFSAGTPSGTVQSVPVTLLPDALDEINETFGVNLSTVTGGSITGPASQTITITDDDATPTLSITDVSLNEGQSGTTSAVFTVSLSAVSGQVVQVQYGTANDTAGAGTDYGATAGTLTLQPGTPSAPISVPILGDDVFEITERFFVNLAAPVAATLADSQGIGTIVNDDLPRKTWGDFHQPLDGWADAALIAASTGVWTFRSSQTGAVSQFGPWFDAGDIPVPTDFDGDGRTDCTVYRPSNGIWYIGACQGGSPGGLQWGWPGVDKPAPADFDGDGLADVAVFRPPDGYWHIRLSATLTMWSLQWGQYLDHEHPRPRRLRRRRESRSDVLHRVQWRVVDLAEQHEQRGADRLGCAGRHECRPCAGRLRRGPSDGPRVLLSRERSLVHRAECDGDRIRRALRHRRDDAGAGGLRRGREGGHRALRPIGARVLGAEKYLWRVHPDCHE